MTKITKKFLQSKRKSTSEKSDLIFIPHDYQKTAIGFMLERPASGLFLAPGLGKTGITLTVLDILKEQKVNKKTLILAKVRIIHSVWPKEIVKWGFNLTCTILHGKDKDKNLKKDVDVYLMNYEGLSWLYRKIKSGEIKFDTLIIDESSKVKSTNTQRFKILKKMLNLFRRRHILTGSPAPNSLIDIFGQIFMLDQGDSLGKYITHFKNSYFFPCGYMGYDSKLQDGAEERIYNAIRPSVIRFGHEMIDLPELVKVDVFIDLPEKARKQYSQLELDFITQVEDKEIVAVNAAVATGKLRQFCNGCIYDENRKTVLIHEEKIEALKEIVEELQGSPCLVGYEFKHDLEALLKAYPKTPFIGGGVSAKEGIKIEKLWNKGKLPLLFGQIASVSHGLNLQESGTNAVFFSLPWNLEDYEQFIQRIHRQGQANSVTIHHLVIENSVDIDVINTLERKDQTQQALLKALTHRLKG